MKLFKKLSPVFGLILLVLLSACADSKESNDTSEMVSNQPMKKLIVYKSPTCGCCKEWMDHLEDSGFETTYKHPESLDEIKAQYQVPSTAQSCHTAVSEQGFVFEGHIPARYIQQFLSNPPKGALGLAVPAMPLGSPGMEVEDRFTPYKVLLLKEDGETEVYAAVDNAEQQ